VHQEIKKGAARSQQLSGISFQIATGRAPVASRIDLRSAEQGR
jgi:hypothetical protein